MEFSFYGVKVCAVFRDAVYDAAEAGTVRIGNEDLAEIRSGNHAYEVGDAAKVQFVEYIVQKEDGREAVGLGHYAVLGELEGYQEGFLLPLAAGVADWMAVHEEDEIVPLWACGSEAEGKVPVPSGREELREGSAQGIGLVLYGYAFSAAGDEAVVLCHHRLQLPGESRSGLDYLPGRRLHLKVQYVKEFPAWGIVLENLVALGQEAVVALCGCKVLAVHLGKDGIHQPAPVFTAFTYKGGVSRRNHYYGKKADMLTHSAYGLSVPGKLFIPAGHFDGESGFGAVLHGVCASYCKTVRTISAVEPVRARESALCHGKIVDCIQKIGLAFSVVPAYAVDVWGETNLLKGNVPEVLYYYFFQSGHGAYNYIANI